MQSCASGPLHSPLSTPSAPVVHPRYILVYGSSSSPHGLFHASPIAIMLLQYVAEPNTFCVKYIPTRDTKPVSGDTSAPHAPAASSAARSARTSSASAASTRSPTISSTHPCAAPPSFPVSGYSRASSACSASAATVTRASPRKSLNVIRSWSYTRRCSSYPSAVMPCGTLYRKASCHTGLSESSTVPERRSPSLGLSAHSVPAWPIRHSTNGSDLPNQSASRRSLAPRTRSAPSTAAAAAASFASRCACCSGFLSLVSLAGTDAQQPMTTCLGLPHSS
mmetsp:Transcript_38045/g.123070  ORF Transcript_38045/g.123070 Transcript_38045/m.123070 type:complete len:279 (-) Transcript_38045:74-910(-)